MIIALFGATGGLGEQVMKQALDRGDCVSALVRTPAKLTIKHANLSVVQADVMHDGRAVLAEKLAGVDAIISALGEGATLGITKLYSDGTQAILDAAKGAGIPRLVAVSSGGTDVTDDEPWWYLRLVRRLLINVYVDQARMEERVRQSGLDWVVVRPAMLTNGQKKGAYRVQLNHNPKGGLRISRADLAAFMLDQVQSDQYLHQFPAVAY